MQPREWRIGLFVAFLWNLLVAAVLNDPIQPSTHTWFVVMGAANELAGVVMIASPELGPIGRRVLAVLTRQVQALRVRVVAKARQLLGIRNTLHAGFSVSQPATASIAIKPQKAAPATLQDVISWVTQHEQDLEDLRKRMDALPAEWKEDIVQKAEETENLARRMILGVENRALSYRVLGVALVILGLVVSTTGNLV